MAQVQPPLVPFSKNIAFAPNSLMAQTTIYNLTVAEQGSETYCYE